MKKIVVIILVVATILNIIAGSFIYIDIQALSMPTTTLTLDLVDLNADEAVLQTTLSTNNTNSFSLIIQNITVTTVTDNGDIINQVSLEGGEIHASEHKTFSSTATVRFNTVIPNTLTSTITGTIGVMFFGLVKKTLPLKLTMITSLHNIINQFTLPHIHLEGNFSDLTQKGVNFTSSIEIANPYTIDLAVENLSVNITTDTGASVGTVTIQGAAIPAKTTQQITGSGTILLKALDAKTLNMNLQGNVIVLVAGIRKTMNLSMDADIIPPQIKDLLSDLPTDASLTAQYKINRKGLLDHISFTVVNPNKITVYATDITIKIYRLDRNKTRLISNGTIADGVIPQQSTTVLQGDMTIPLRQLFFPHKGEHIIADEIELVMRANFTIDGLNQTVWVGMIGYQNFPFHRQ
jgi:hypothetical protein